jgi:rare lipoprotein A
MGKRFGHVVPVAVMALVGAGLLRSSIPVGAEPITTRPSLKSRVVSLSLASSESGTPAVSDAAAAGFWAVETVPSLPSGTDAGAATRPARFPDGLTVLRLRVTIGGNEARTILTNALGVRDLLDAMDVRVGPRDLVRPRRGSFLGSGMTVRVIRVRQVIRAFASETPYRTLIQYSKDLFVGDSRVLTPGHTGQEVKTYRITFRNGREVSRVLLSNRLVASPEDQVVERGTKPTLAPAPSGTQTQTGQASWYDCTGLYAAHLTLPFGTKVTVTNLDNGATVTVVINDRGPYGVAGRIIDLCSTAFAEIAPLGQGVANVTISW